MSAVKDVSGIPTTGEDLIIVADVDNSLHFRMFDGDGKVVVDTDEKGLTKRSRQIADLRKRLVGLWWVHELAGSERERVITAVTSIVGHTLPSLRKQADDAPAGKGRTGARGPDRDAVEHLGQVTLARVETAQEVQKKIKPPNRWVHTKIKPPDQPTAHPSALKSLAEVIRRRCRQIPANLASEALGKTRQGPVRTTVLHVDRRVPEQPTPWDERVKGVNRSSPNTP